MMPSLNRRSFLQNVSSGIIGAAVSSGRAWAEDAPAGAAGTATQRPPNILLIITDDQGYGDLGCHGNPILKTPHLDRLHEESVRFTRFYTCPVCSPTRACLMTGRYNYRTGVVDTYAGRSMMDPEEKTIAALLKDAGYTTGIFGKWHLGDTWPLRPIDRGFDESLVHRGGGIAQPSDPEFFVRQDTYFNPMLQHNGRQERYPGYCSDIFATAALAFMETHRERPFFTYLAFNAPHTPLQVPEEDVAPYNLPGLNEETARVYGMITNTDYHIGRVLKGLSDMGLERDTIVLFITDNGAQQLAGNDRYTAGLRGWKGSVYDGGIRVPCFIRWPNGFSGGRDIDRIAAAIDITPTLLSLCAVSLNEGPAFDGVTLAPLLRESPAALPWPDRTLFFQWHRGDIPEAFKNSAVRNQRWKLVNGAELYDMSGDPAEERDVAPLYPEIVKELRDAYLNWFQDVGSTRGYGPVRIHAGSAQENPVVLTRQDARDAANWTSKQAGGFWEIRVEETGEYEVTVLFDAPVETATLFLKLGEKELRQAVAPGESNAVLKHLHWNAGDYRLECGIVSGDLKTSPQFIQVFKK